MIWQEGRRTLCTYAKGRQVGLMKEILVNGTTIHKQWVDGVQQRKEASIVF
jgi:hypothetical protein